MDSRQREFWFPAKRYGWGWGLPVAWQGWAVLIAYAAVLGLWRPAGLRHAWAYVRALQ